MRFKKLLIAIALLFSSKSFAVLGVGDVVHDPIAFALQMQQNIQDLANFAKEYGIETDQLNNLLMQLEQAKMLYQSLTGLTRQGFNQSQLAGIVGAFPVDYNMMYQALGIPIDTILKKNLILSVNDMPVNSSAESIRLFEKIRQQRATYEAEFKHAYDVTESNFGVIENLLDQINQSEDLKTTADLQAKMLVMIATLINDSNRNFSMAQLELAKEKNNEQQAKEISIIAPPIVQGQDSGMFGTGFNGSPISSDGVLMQ